MPAAMETLAFLMLLLIVIFECLITFTVSILRQPLRVDLEHPMKIIEKRNPLLPAEGRKIK